MDQVRREFAAFVEELRRERVAAEMRGCSSAEIREIEEKLGCPPPLAYRLFLETMGHSAGRLFAHDHLAVTYPRVLELREELEDAMAESGAVRFSLPSHALVIEGRLGDQFHYIVCDGSEETPVSYVNTWDQRPRQAYAGVIAWLRERKAEALEAIRSGYFDRYPRGTTP